MKPLILVGMNPRNRAAIPWEGDAEIWTLNEAPVSAWLKRYDVLWQLHPRWDWDRRNNIADPNHPHYLRAESGPCYFCRGLGHLFLNGEAEKKCPYCTDGQYILPEHRAGKRIMMQDNNGDVPYCVQLPISRMIQGYCAGGAPYFTSTLAHMLVFAFLASQENNRYSNVTLYGFEMESGTEYEHQRACAEYWIGYGRALGIQIEAPGAHILRGEHYAYTTWQQGYRSRLEIRVDVLRQQLQAAQGVAIKSEGALAALTPFKSLPEVAPVWDQTYDDHFKKKNMISFLNGTIKELENAIQIYDAYHGHADGSEPESVKDNLGLTYQMG